MVGQGGHKNFDCIIGFMKTSMYLVSMHILKSSSVNSRKLLIWSLKYLKYFKQKNKIMYCTILSQRAFLDVLLIKIVFTYDTLLDRNGLKMDYIMHQLHILFYLKWLKIEYFRCIFVKYLSVEIIVKRMSFLDTEWNDFYLGAIKTE